MSDNQGPGPLALVGSGEYLPQMAEIEGGSSPVARRATSNWRPRRYPTAHPSLNGGTTWAGPKPIDSAWKP